MTDILVTAFQPFGGDEINPTELILSSLPDELAGFKLHKRLLPVEFVAAPKAALEAIESIRPRAAVLLGQAGGRKDVTPERVAINIMDARIPDNAGFEPHDAPITKDGPAAYFSTLPIRSIEKELKDIGLPASVSNTAGTYVCNTLMYSVLHGLKTKGMGGIPAGFIHFPFIRQQVEGREERRDMPFIELEDGIRAVEAIVKTVAETVKTL